MKAKVELKSGYPIIPPLWHLTLEKAPPCQTIVDLPAEYRDMMDNPDQVEALRATNQCLSSGEPVQPILEQIQDELHLHY